MGNYVLECCVDSVESAWSAAKGGADRLELCQNLMIGGTTPSAALFQEIKDQLHIRIHVLIRPRFGDFCYTESEKNIMLREVRMFREMGAEGVVIGALTPEGKLDVEFLKSLTGCAKGMSVTLHRAFDMCSDPHVALEEAAGAGIHTILTSGQKNSALQGADLLRALREQAKGRVAILAGGGVSAEVIDQLYEETGITSYHMSGKMIRDSQMTFRREGVSMGLPSFSEYEIWCTDEEKIIEARAVLDRLEGRR